jgi:hypothetical protein
VLASRVGGFHGARDGAGRPVGGCARQLADGVAEHGVPVGRFDLGGQNGQAEFISEAAQKVADQQTDYVEIEASRYVLALTLERDMMDRRVH